VELPLDRHRQQYYPRKTGPPQLDPVQALPAVALVQALPVLAVE
jgi:hypothetical protein